MKRRVAAIISILVIIAFLLTIIAPLFQWDVEEEQIIDCNWISGIVL